MTNHPAKAYHDRKRKEVDDKLCSVAAQYINEVGVGNVTIEGLAVRSGIAKTTIYRRFKNSEDMVGFVMLGPDYVERSRQISDLIANEVWEAFGNDADGQHDDRIAKGLIKFGVHGVVSAAIAVERQRT